jgi:bleomycin hydrolase
MKFNTLTLFLIGVSYYSFGQFGYTEPVTNAEGSEYEFFKIVHLEATPVESQGNTGTCWSFSGTSFFESELIRMGTKDPDLLSEMYIARKSYEAKAIKYIRLDGKGNFSQGGETHDIPYVIKNYGIVPVEIYPGLSYGTETHDHDELFKVLDGAVQGVLSHLKSKGKKPLSTAWKDALNGILDAYFGDDILSFEFKGKKYTPKTYAEAIGLNMDDYISLTSFTNHEMNALCELEIPDNWTRGKSYNVSLEDLIMTCENAVREGFTIAWAMDVSESGFSFKNGLAINPAIAETVENNDYGKNGFKTPVKEIEVTAELRQQGYDNKTTTDDHLMHIVGLYKDQNGSKYFLAKNSWGTGNLPEGYLYASESYFKAKTMMIYLHKDGVSKEVKKKLGLGN